MGISRFVGITTIYTPLHTAFSKLREIMIGILFPSFGVAKKLEAMTAEDFDSCVKRADPVVIQNVTALYDYHDPLMRGAVWELKYRGNISVAKIFAELVYNELLQHSAEILTFSQGTKIVLVPIPLSRERRRERGFNQCELILDEFAAFDKDKLFSIQKNLLVKTRNTLPQTSMKNRKERLQNLRGCFTVTNRDLVKDTHIIILDDVITTGSTLEEAAKTLRKSGTHSVSGIALAH